jgi:DNA-directed RNA polymerase subunit N (RpoN/RPB10)
MDGKWMDCGNPVEKAWEEYQAVLLEEMTILTIPQVTRASLTRFSGRPELTL